MRRLLVVLICLVLVLSWRLLSPMPISQIMEQHAEPLEKVKSGIATADDMQMLLDLYTDLRRNKPPRGDAGNWKMLTAKLVAATQQLVDGQEGARDEFLKAVDCNPCHDAHRGH